MKLRNLSVKNLRGLHDVSFQNHDLTTLIGRNNCGKSSLLRAIELLCTGIKPDFEEYYLREVDLIEIDGTFVDLKDWERNSPAISALVYNNELRLKYVASITTDEANKKKIDVEYYAFRQLESIHGWSEVWSDLSQQIKDIAQEVGISTAATFRTKANKEKIKQKIRDSYSDLMTYGDADWSNESIPFNNSLQQALPKVIVIPAVRDATEESKYSKTGKAGAFGELMRRLILPSIQAEDSYIQISQAIAILAEKIQSPEGIAGLNEINRKLSDRLSRLISAKAGIKFDSPDIDSAISSSVGLRIYDGSHDTPIGLQGHGLQRTLIFSLLEMVAENDAMINDSNSRTTILLYEEPELYLHPQMLRKLKSILKSISISESWQVVCSTHSPVFIDVADRPESLVILSRSNNNCILAKQLSSSPFEESPDGRMERDALRAAIDFHPTVCEVFFANKVVLVEGDTEMALFKHCDELLSFCGVDLEKAADCTIVSCGGKWTIPAIARLLSRFGIGFKIVHDLDRHEVAEEDLIKLPAIHPYRANARISLVTDSSSIFVCEDTLEDLWDGSKSDKPYSAIKKNIDLVQSNRVPQKLVELVVSNPYFLDNLGV